VVGFVEFEGYRGGQPERLADDQEVIGLADLEAIAYFVFKRDAL